MGLANCFNEVPLQFGSMLGALAASLIVVDCVAQTASPAPSAESTPPPISSASTATPAPLMQEVIISGNPSMLRADNPWWWGNPVPPCATFRVSAEPSVVSLVLYTSGLGRTLLAERAKDEGSICPDGKDLHDRITLAKDSSGGAINRFVSMKLDPDLLSFPGISVQGNVIALAGAKKASEFALKVERSPRADVWTAITWVLSVLVPAAIGFLIARGAIWLDARRKEDAEFRDFRLRNASQVLEFLRGIDVVIRSPLQQQPGQTVFELALQRGIFEKMPRTQSDSLYAACHAHDLERIVQAVKMLFPEFKSPIATLENSLTLEKGEQKIR